MLFFKVQAKSGNTSGSGGVGRLQGPMPSNRQGTNLIRNGAGMRNSEYNEAFRNEAGTRNNGGRLTDGRVNNISPRRNASGGRGGGTATRNRAGGR